MDPRFFGLPPFGNELWFKCLHPKAQDFEIAKFNLLALYDPDDVDLKEYSKGLIYSYLSKYIEAILENITTPNPNGDSAIKALGPNYPILLSNFKKVLEKALLPQITETPNPELPETVKAIVNIREKALRDVRINQTNTAVPRHLEYTDEIQMLQQILSLCES
jgi:hypothetical protein